MKRSVSQALVSLAARPLVRPVPRPPPDQERAFRKYGEHLAAPAPVQARLAAASSTATSSGASATGPSAPNECYRDDLQSFLDSLPDVVTLTVKELRS